MTSQTARRIQVSPVRLTIMAIEIKIPIIGTNGTHGVLNERGRSGSRRQISHTPAHTITKASSVPMLTISSRTLMGSDAASAATKVPTVREEIHGVRNFGWTLLNIAGNSPSFDMEKKTR